MWRTSAGFPAGAKSLPVAAITICLAGPAFAGTVVWYRFEEGVGKEHAAGIGAVLDSSRNRLHGTCAGESGAPYAHAIAPFGKAALTIRERGDWAFVPDSAKLQLTKSLTLEAWVNIRRFQPNGVANFILFRGDDRPGNDPYVLALDPREGTLHFTVEGPGGKPGDPLARVSTPFARYLGETVHVAGVLNDATGFLGLYMNGRLKDSIETHVRPRKQLHPIYQPGLGIGGFFAGPPPGSFCIDGTIDEARISNVALSPEEFLTSLPAAREP
jgi:hypothetical protein